MGMRRVKKGCRLWEGVLIGGEGGGPLCILKRLRQEGDEGIRKEMRTLNAVDERLGCEE